MSVKKLIGKKVSITTGLATFRDVRGTVVDASETIIEIKEDNKRILFIPLSNCGLIRIENDGNELFKSTPP